MSEIMAKYKIHTVIPDGARCASSCASIAFIAGKYRTMEAYGLLGQHSCSLDGLPDKKCNDILSENAVQHGVDHGAVAAFATYISPQDILWLSREDVDAWEISRYAGSDESNYVRLSPHLYEFMKHQKKPAQAAWRIKPSAYSAYKVSRP